MVVNAICLRLFIILDHDEAMLDIKRRNIDRQSSLAVVLIPDNTPAPLLSL